MSNQKDKRDFEDEGKPLFEIGSDDEMPTKGMSPDQFLSAVAALRGLDPRRFNASQDGEV